MKTSSLVIAGIVTVLASIPLLVLYLLKSSAKGWK